MGHRRGLDEAHRIRWPLLPRPIPLVSIFLILAAFAVSDNTPSPNASPATRPKLSARALPPEQPATH